jgi:hypothetical protein
MVGGGVSMEDTVGEEVSMLDAQIEDVDDSL